MAKSSFLGSLVGAAGSRLSLFLIEKGGASRKLATTKADADGRFAFQVDSSAASSAIRMVRGGDATLQLEAAIGDRVVQVELPSRSLPSGSRAPLRSVDLGEISASPTRRAKTRKLLSQSSAIDLLTTGGTVKPLETSPMLADLRLQVANQSAELGSLRAQLGSRNADVLNLQTQLGRRDTDLSKLQNDLSSARSQISALTAARDQALVERTSLAKQLSERNAAFTDTQNALKASQARIDALSADFARSQSELSAKEARLRALEQELNAPGRPVPLTSVIEGMGGQVAASASNINKLGGWSLSDVRVQLKMMVTDGGTKVHFPKPGEVPAAAEVSAVDFVLRPGPTTTSTRAEVSVPNVVGYSPLVAERKLRALGLGVATSYQTVKEIAGAPKRAGRVMTQRPAAGGKVAPAAVVELLIGKT